MKFGVIESLRKRYDMHPLIFHRSVEYASTEGELFDILDTVPENPIKWDEEQRRWVHLEDVYQSSLFESFNR